MQAWQIDFTPSSFTLRDTPDPEPGPGELRVALKYVGLNHLDLWVAKGKPAPSSFPFTGGADGAGIVHGLGDGVEMFNIGDEVIINPYLFCGECEACKLGDEALCPDLALFGEDRNGTFADFVIVPERNLTAKPKDMDWQVAGACALTNMTAYRMLTRTAVSAGDKVLITGIGGGVAHAALDQANALGAEVTVTSRSEEKLKLASADHGLLSDNDFPEGAFDVVIDSVGAALWPKSLRALKKGGRLAICGGTAGATVELKLPPVWWQQWEIIGSSGGSVSDFLAVIAMVEQGLPVVIDSTHPFEQFDQALARMEAGDQLGKIVIVH